MCGFAKLCDQQSPPTDNPLIPFPTRTSTILAEGDLAIVHGRFSDFGAPVNWIAADIVRIEAGELAEHWMSFRMRPRKSSRKVVRACLELHSRPMLEEQVSIGRVTNA